jgi:hypothetical protein
MLVASDGIRHAHWIAKVLPRRLPPEEAASDPNPRPARAPHAGARLREELPRALVARKVVAHGLQDGVQRARERGLEVARVQRAAAVVRGHLLVRGVLSARSARGSAAGGLCGALARAGACGWRASLERAGRRRWQHSELLSLARLCLCHTLVLTSRPRQLLRCREMRQACSSCY